MLHDIPRKMTIWEAADIIECMLGDNASSLSEDQKHKALEVALKALRHKADKSYCQHVKNPDGTYHKCIMPFNLCMDCPINRYLIGRCISEEDMAKELIALGWGEMLTPECRQKYEETGE